MVVVTALGSPALEWAHIQRAVAGRTASYLYDRAGLGWSEPGPWPRTAGRLADELDQLLRSADIAPPYVLVGHSLGGHVARLYAARHPERLAGMVLVDASHEDMDRRLVRILGWQAGAAGRWMHAARVRLRPLGLLRVAARVGLATGRQEVAVREFPPDWVEAGAVLTLDSKRRRAVVQELVAFSRSAGQVGAQAGSLGRLPLAVLSGGFKGRERYEAVWPALQAELTQLSEHATQTFAPHTGHHVHLDDPDLVVRVIRDFLDRCGSNKR